MFWIIFFSLFFVGFYIFTLRFRNPYRLYLIFGKKGSGKSTYLTKLAIRYLKKGWIVYTNMSDMVVPDVRIIDDKDIGKFVPETNCVLLLDEVGMTFDNRNFKNFSTDTRDFFKLQRHYRCICYMASQSFDIDKKLRDLTDGMFLHVNWFGFLSVGKRIRRSVTLTEPSGDAESRIADSLKFMPIWYWTFTLIPKYSRFFSSFALPEKPLLPFTLVGTADRR